MSIFLVFGKNESKPIWFQNGFKIAIRTGLETFFVCLWLQKKVVMVITSFKAQTKIKMKHMEEKTKRQSNLNVCIEI